MSLSNNTASLTALLESVNALPDKIDTSGTATAADIYTGKTATVNDTKLTGTNPYNAANVDPAVTSALAAIAEKGVDTTGKGLADIAALVESIESGGGETYKVAYGEITPASETDSIVIEHNLGVKPIAFIAMLKSSYSSSSGGVILQIDYMPNRHYGAGGWAYFRGSRSSHLSLTGYSPVNVFNESVADLTLSNGDLFSTKPYEWIAVG